LDPAKASAALKEELLTFIRSRISHVKSPKSIDFITDMPRTETGKLLKRLVKQRYWPEGTSIAK